MNNRSILDAYKVAFKGLTKVVFERSFRQMLIAVVAVSVMMFYFPTSQTEKILLVVMIFLVLTLELINSVIERIMNFVHPDYHEKVGEIKDMMAGAVLLISIGAAIVGGMIFWPYIHETLRI